VFEGLKTFINLGSSLQFEKKIIDSKEYKTYFSSRSFKVEETNANFIENAGNLVLFQLISIFLLILSKLFSLEKSNTLFKRILLMHLEFNFIVEVIQFCLNPILVYCFL
jgi:hypothetical protein